MTEERERARHALDELRDPLARVELAASQLVRTPLGPGPEALAARILSAARDLDQRLSESISALEPLRPDAHARDDCLAAVTTAVEQMAPILAARDISVCSPSPRGVGVQGDGSFARRAVFQLLRAGGRWASGGGRLTLALREASGAYAIELTSQRANRRTTAREDVFDDARRFARSEGAELVTQTPTQDPLNAIATLWRRRAEATA